VYRELHKYDQWIELWKKGAALNQNADEIMMAEEAARIYPKSGYPATVRRLIELQLQISKRSYVDPAEIAINYAELGDKDQAFAWLEKGYAEKSNLMVWIKIIPELDNLRSDPRYAALVKKMGMP
jgi:tetratricopeptide (TPR) repeat protein